MKENDSYSISKSIRIFYRLILKHIMPNEMSVSSEEKKQHEEIFLNNIGLKLKELLEPSLFQVSFDKEIGVTTYKEDNVKYLIPFAISKVYELKSDDIIIPDPSYTGFRVGSDALFSIKKEFTQEVYDVLENEGMIYELFFDMVACRSFVFEIYYEGFFKVKYEFTNEKIESAGGVRLALEEFYEEIEASIEPFGFMVTSTPSSRQRSSNDEYLFGIYYAPLMSFRESDVYGEGCYAIRGDSTIDEINLHGISFEDALVNETNTLLNMILDENLPLYVDLISCEIDYVDDPGEASDIDYELIIKNQNLGDNMLKRPVNELKFVKSRNPIPAVEIDIDSIPEGFYGYSDLVTKALSSVAEKSHKLLATVYVYQSMSVSFHQNTWSAFLGVAGDKNLLDVLLHEFYAAKIDNVRHGEYIESSSAIKEFHIQDGYVWQPLEADTWYTVLQHDTEGSEIVATEPETLEDELPQDNEYEFFSSTPTRYRVARSDASVGTIRRKVEKIFGLPEGSVILCGPDGKALRRDAKIATLRKRWEQ